MSEQKKISAREAGIAVLKKAEEMMKKTAMMKAPAETPVAPAAPAMQATKDPMAHPTAEDRMGGNPEPGTQPSNLKGPLKLAKFVGRMEHKRSQKTLAAQTQAPASPAPQNPGAVK